MKYVWVTDATLKPLYCRGMRNEAKFVATRRVRNEANFDVAPAQNAGRKPGGSPEGLTPQSSPDERWNGPTRV